MGKLDLFEIVFATQPPVFFAGQYVSGHVNVKLNDGMKMRNLRLKFQGKALVCDICFWKKVELCYSPFGNVGEK